MCLTLPGTLITVMGVEGVHGPRTLEVILAAGS